MPEGKWRIDESSFFGVVSLIALTAATHVTIADFDFAPADRQALIYNGFGRQLGDLWALVSGAAHAGRVPDAWHPLAVLTRTVDVALFDLHPAGYHLHNGLWHLLVVLLTAAWLRRAFADDRLAWLAAALLATWPAHTASVSLIEHRGVLIASAAIAAGLWASLAGRRWLAALCLLLGLLAHELALLLIPLWPLVSWTRDVKLDVRGAITGARLDALWMAGGAFAALFLRAWWLPYVAWPETPDRGGLLYLAGACLRTGLMQLGQLVVPIGLGAHHPDPPATWFPTAEWLLAAALVAGLLFAVRRGLDRLLIGGALWAVVGLTPLVIPWSLRHLWSDSLLYLSAVGVTIVVARLVTRFVWRWRLRWLVVGALLALLVLAHQRSQAFFQDGPAIWQRASTLAPNDVRTWRGAFAQALGSGRTGEAEILSHAARRRFPDDPVVLAQAAGLACLRHEEQPALALFAAVPAHPTPARLRLQQAGCAMRFGRFAQARQFAGEAHARSPWMPDPLAIRGEAHHALGDVEAAEADLIASCRLHPTRRDLWVGLLRFYSQRGRHIDAARVQSHLDELAAPPETRPGLSPP